MRELLKKAEEFYYTKVLEFVRRVSPINVFYAFFVFILSLFLWRN